MPTIRKLTQPELKEIFKTNMREDFPLMELRPWFSIERAWDRGEYSAYGYFEGEKFLGYAAFYVCGSYVLMDYFAVVSELRGQGIGSSFLRELVPEIKTAEGIFIEAERPEPDKDDEETLVKRKRIDFYRSNGAVPTGTGCHLFGVDYEILFLPGERDISGMDFYEEVCSLYLELYRPVYGKICKPYVIEG